MRIPRFLRFEKYETIDIKEFLSDNKIEVHLRRDKSSKFSCTRCAESITPNRGDHYMRVEAMPIMGHRCYLVFRRYKGYCTKCKKVRSERVDFISDETPHKTQEYAWWIGRMCEIASVTRVAELMREDGMTTWRLDFRRMRRMFQHYRLAEEVTAISVDEVYVKKKKQRGESRNDCFFTIITDLKSRKVIWVSSGRSKEALDEFYLLLGEKACKKIRTVVTDQFEGYSASTNQYCPNATLVWDRFHLTQAFNEALNEDRKDELARAMPGGYTQRLLRGQYRFIFLKKSYHRTKEEQFHIDDLSSMNKKIAQMEIIKEHFHRVFEAKDKMTAKIMMSEIYQWAWDCGARAIWKWVKNIREQERFWNYFDYRVTTSVSEGINNVIKMIKRRAFGYRNMQYFKLKILQVCGYLNSRFIPDPSHLISSTCT